MPASFCYADDQSSYMIFPMIPHSSPESNIIYRGATFSTLFIATPRCLRAESKMSPTRYLLILLAIHLINGLTTDIDLVGK